MRRCFIPSRFNILQTLTQKSKIRQRALEVSICGLYNGRTANTDGWSYTLISLFEAITSVIPVKALVSSAGIKIPSCSPYTSRHRQRWHSQYQVYKSQQSKRLRETCGQGGLDEMFCCVYSNTARRLFSLHGDHDIWCRLCCCDCYDIAAGILWMSFICWKFSIPWFAFFFLISYTWRKIKCRWDVFLND